METPGNLFVVAAPSGAGKSSLVKALLELDSHLVVSVSHTTRAPRGQEQQGREYHFVDNETFEEMIRIGAFAEWARVHDYLYGTSLKEIDLAKHAARGVLFDIDYQGARQIKAALPSAVGVFILPPSLAELERRLRGRGTEDEQTTRRRLKNAKGEIEHYGLFDYLVVNDDFGRALAELHARHEDRQADHVAAVDGQIDDSLVFDNTAGGGVFGVDGF